MSLEVIRAEMARQHADARASFDRQYENATRIVDSVAKSNRLIMLGMGASHWINRMAVKSYRQLGIDASAEILSDYMRSITPKQDITVLLTSQSGESGEIIAYFRRVENKDHHFALTLNKHSLLARTVPCLIGYGPREKAYAATRSIIVTLALHAAILAQLGADQKEFLAVLNSAYSFPQLSDNHIIRPLLTCDTLFLSARSNIHTVLEVAALTYMELARVPAIALELGQLVHGPIECLSPNTGLVLARSSGEDALGVTRLAESAVNIGITPVLFDLSDLPAIAGTVCRKLPAHTGLAAIITLLPDIQWHLILAAHERTTNFGVPLRSSKITDGEAA